MGQRVCGVLAFSAMSENLKNALEPGLEAFVRRAMKRERVFFAVTWVGVAVGLGWAGWYALGVEEPVGTVEWLVVVLVLLNARQNLRQVKYARALSALMGASQT
jgi:hypothetical protein